MSQATAEASQLGPGWSPTQADRYSGRFPLSVERHAAAGVGALLPGFTTVTAHARQYTLHAVLAAEAAARRLTSQEAQRLLRRCEVVCSAVATAHRDPHPGMARAHGAEKIRPLVDRDALNLAAVSAKGAYSNQDWGFWGPYIGSEAVLHLVDRVQGTPVLGARARAAAPDLIGSFEGLLDLAARDTVSVEDLRAHQHLCLCACATAPDGALLRDLFLPVGTDQAPLNGYDRRRANSIRLLLALIDASPDPVENPGSLSVPLLFDDWVHEENRITSNPAFEWWQAISLRAYSVRGWRDLWAWLVGQIEGLMAIESLGLHLADSLADSLADVLNDSASGANPGGTVRQFAAALPDAFRPGTAARATGSELVLAGAEREQWLAEASTPLRSLAYVFLGAARVGRLPAGVEQRFQSDRDRTTEQLSPTWVAARIEEWADRPLSDFAVWLTKTLIERSQRLAMRKARVTRQGVYQQPTRVAVRDGYVFRDSNEGGGGIGLRWTNTVQILGAAGFATLVEPNQPGEASPARTGWVLTDSGRAA